MNNSKLEIIEINDAPSGGVIARLGARPIFVNVKPDTFIAMRSPLFRCERL